MRIAIHMRMLVVSIAAVVAFSGVLGVLQYRSLTQLETRTRTTFQDDLVRSAQAIGRGVETDLQSVASDSLVSFRKQDADQEVRQLTIRFRELLSKRPEIDEIFLFALDGPKGTSAVFSTADGAVRCT